LAADTRIKAEAAAQIAEGRPLGRSHGRIGAGPPRSATLSSPTDQLNRAIVRLLQEDGRLPFKTIAEKLDVSEGTVRNRVGWMKSSGMLRIVAVADPTAMNYRADAMLGIKIAPSSSPAKVGERLAVHPEVVYILWVSGRFDLLIEIVSESEEDFLEFLSKHCFDQEDIASLEVMTGLAMYKNQFLLKQDYP
jgi:Lrp/AsnC family transcriptional regulator for asnA, asnC and gidA